MCSGWRAGVVMMPGGDLDPRRARGDRAEERRRLLEVPALREEHPAEAEALGVDAVLDALRRGAGVGLVPDAGRAWAVTRPPMT
jgi:hypothetical protein